MFRFTIRELVLVTVIALILWAAMLSWSVIRKTPPTTDTVRNMAGCLVALIVLSVIITALFPAVQ